MKQQLTVYTPLLIEWEAFCGHSDPRQWLADEVGCSKSWINHVCSGTVPGPKMRKRICRATGIAETDLFPVYEAERRSA
jgi:hypothetical protein